MIYKYPPTQSIKSNFQKFSPLSYLHNNTTTHISSTEEHIQELPSLENRELNFNLDPDNFSHRRLDLSSLVLEHDCYIATSSLPLSRHRPEARYIYTRTWRGRRERESFVREEPNLSCLADKLLGRRSLGSLFPRRWSRRRPPTNEAPAA